MAFYGKMRRVNHFVYRKIFAEIYHTLEGATHCEIPHEPDKLKCDGCGAPIYPKEVWLVHISGYDIGLPSESLKDAEELAKMWIDDLSDPPPDFFGPEPPLDEGKKGKENGRGPKERDAKNPVAGNGHQRIIAAVRQLGWGKKLAALIAKRRGKGK